MCWACRVRRGTSAETTPLRASELPAIGAVVLDSPVVVVQQPHAPSALRGDSSSGGSSYGDGDLGGVISPGKLGPSDYELLRVVGQGAFGKVATGSPVAAVVGTAQLWFMSHCTAFLSLSWAAA